MQSRPEDQESPSGPRESGSGSASSPTVGERVSLRKPHACGGYEWTITRVGADIGLQCAMCARRIFLPRDEYLRRAKR